MAVRTPITLLVLVGILLGAAYYGWQTVINPATEATTTQGPTHASKPTCVKQKQFLKGQEIKAADIVVNVFNAGTISGLAGDALSALHQKGFQMGIAANPPGGVGATNVTVLTDSPQSPEVRLVVSQFLGKVLVRKGPNLAPGIDVVIGQDFKGIAEKAPTTLRLSHDVTTCLHLVTPAA